MKNTSGTRVTGFLMFKGGGREEGEKRSVTSLWLVNVKESLQDFSKENPRQREGKKQNPREGEEGALEIKMKPGARGLAGPAPRINSTREKDTEKAKIK